jgi:hypothetical protein
MWVSWMKIIIIIIIIIMRQYPQSIMVDVFRILNKGNRQLLDSILQNKVSVVIAIFKISYGRLGLG